MSFSFASFERRLVAGLAAAAGWTVFMVLDWVEGGVAGLVMGLVVVVLAAPVAWQLDGVRGEIELQQSVSGMLLMLMVARRVLFDDQVAAQQWVFPKVCTDQLQFSIDLAVQRRRFPCQ